MMLMLPLLLIIMTLSVVIVDAHVVMMYPKARTNNDYLFSFDEGVCNPRTTCPSFCGDPYNNSNISIYNYPVTVLEVGVPLTLRWMITVSHQPYQYRLSLNPAPRDADFDLPEHELITITNEAAKDDPASNPGSTGSFSANVTIPHGAPALKSCSLENGDDPCVLQLWDKYFFVSCANVLLTTAKTPVAASNNDTVADAENSTLTPSPAPTTDSVICFSGETTVQEKTRGTIRMKDLKLGDQVLVVDGRHNKPVYEPVYSFGHRNTEITAEFLRLEPSGLELSENHMVFVRGRGAIPAALVKLGDVLEGSFHEAAVVVEAIFAVQQKGAYAPFTSSGTIVVNGIKASTYVSFQGSERFVLGSGSSFPWRGWKTPITYQWLARSFEAPHRTLCRFVLDCSSESYSAQEGFSVWVYRPLQATNVLLNQGLVMQLVIMIPLVTLFLIFTNIIVAITAVLLVATGLLLLWRQQHTQVKSSNMD